MAKLVRPEDENVYADITMLRRLQHYTKGFSFLPGQPANSLLAGKNVSKLRGRGLNFEELRHYRPGDDIRSMDWKVTHRTGKPHIKVYTEERERNVFLMVDQRSSMFFGSSHKMKSVIAAEAAALVAWSIVGGGDRVGAIVYGDEGCTVIPAKRGRQHVVRLLNTIVQYNQRLTANTPFSEHGATRLNDALEKILVVAGKNALICLLSDGHGWNEKTTHLLKKIRQHNELITCHTVDPLELKLPKMQRMVVSDGAQQIQFSSADSNIQTRYQDNIQQQLDAYSHAAKKYRIPFISINTIDPVAKQLRKALGGIG